LKSLHLIIIEIVDQSFARAESSQKIGEIPFSAELGELLIAKIK
jgi:hypothetical protein